MEKTILKHLEDGMSQSQPVKEIQQSSAKGNRSGLAGKEVLGQTPMQHGIRCSGYTVGKEGGSECTDLSWGTVSLLRLEDHKKYHYVNRFKNMRYFSDRG